MHKHINLYGDADPSQSVSVSSAPPDFVFDAPPARDSRGVVAFFMVLLVVSTLLAMMTFQLVEAQAIELKEQVRHNDDCALDLETCNAISSDCVPSIP